MNIQELRIYLANTVAMAVSLSDVEQLLQIVALCLSISFSIRTWYKDNKKKKKK